MKLNEVHTNHENASTSLKLILLVFALVLVGALGYLVSFENKAIAPASEDYAVDTGSRQQSGCINKGSKSEPLTDPMKIGSAVYSAIEKSTDGNWDKVMSVDCYNDDYTAAWGGYSAGYDQWPWLAWRQDSNSDWNVLVNRDGYSCGELAEMPERVTAELKITFEGCIE